MKKSSPEKDAAKTSATVLARTLRSFEPQRGQITTMPSAASIR
jgi:hypothetical protein